jgi:hypothetical protein
VGISDWMVPHPVKKSHIMLAVIVYIASGERIGRTVCVNNLRENIAFLASLCNKVPVIAFMNESND